MSNKNYTGYPSPASAAAYVSAGRRSGDPCPRGGSQPAVQEEIDLWKAWNREAIETLVRIYGGPEEGRPWLETGERVWPPPLRETTEPSKAGEQGAPHPFTPGRTVSPPMEAEDRFTLIAKGVEQAFSGANGTVLALTLRFSAFEERVTEALTCLKQEAGAGAQPAMAERLQGIERLLREIIDRLPALSPAPGGNP